MSAAALCRKLNVRQTFFCNSYQRAFSGDSRENIFHDSASLVHNKRRMDPSLLQKIDNSRAGRSVDLLLPGKREINIVFRDKTFRDQFLRSFHDPAERPLRVKGSAPPDHAVLNDPLKCRFFPLGFLCRNRDQEIFQKTLEEVFSIRRSTASRLLKNMEAEGLIVRLPVSRDARLKRVMVTPKAEALNQQAAIRIQYVEAALTRGLTQEELDQFMATVEKLKHNLTELSNPRPEAERSTGSPHANS